MVNEPSLSISPEDFDTYRKDRFLLTVFVLAEYERNATNESRGEGQTELRQAFLEVTVQRWNKAPVAVAMVTNTAAIRIASEDTNHVNGSPGPRVNQPSPKTTKTKATTATAIVATTIRPSVRLNQLPRRMRRRRLRARRGVTAALLRRASPGG